MVAICWTPHGCTAPLARKWAELRQVKLAVGILAAGCLIAAGNTSAGPARDGPDVPRIAQEARQTIAMIDWFYVQHRACPQPARAAELHEMEGGLGDGFSVELQGQFAAIHGISMLSGWLYYASPRYPDRCSLYRQLGRDAVLLWRRHGGSAEWVVDPGDGGPERRIDVAP